MKATEYTRRKRDACVAILDSVTKLGCWIAALSLGVIVLLTVIEVALRYFYNRPLDWSGDATSYLFCIVIFLAMPEVSRRHGHIAVDLLINNLKQRSKSRANQLIRWITGVLCLITAWFAFNETIRLAEQGIHTLGVLMIPKWWISIFIPIGFALSGAQFILQTEQNTKQGDLP